jgi:hypothetical protein
MYSREVSTTFILSDATLSTQTAMSTNSTTILYTEESKTEYKKTVTHTITHSSSTVEPVDGSFSTVGAQISELDTIGFDEVIDLDE